MSAGRDTGGGGSRGAHQPRIHGDPNPDDPKRGVRDDGRARAAEEPKARVLGKEKAKLPSLSGTPKAANSIKCFRCTEAYGG